MSTDVDAGLEDFTTTVDADASSAEDQLEEMTRFAVQQSDYHKTEAKRWAAIAKAHRSALKIHREGADA